MGREKGKKNVFRTPARKEAGTVKFDDLEYEKVLDEVSLLWRRGWTQAAIAEKVGVSQPTVSVYLEKMRSRYRESSLWEMDEYVKEKLAQYRDVMRAAWEGYELSVRPKTTTTEKLGIPFTIKLGEGRDGPNKKPRKNSPEEDLVRLEKTIRTEELLPATAYLQIYLECIKAQRELLGLDAPKKTESKSQVQVESFNWDTFVQTALTPNPNDPLALLAAEEQKAREALKVVTENK